MAISLHFHKTYDDLFARSKMWGSPDLPEGMDYPAAEVEDDGATYSDPLMFVCQIRLEDIAPLDGDGLLPHTGMLYCFAQIEYFFGAYKDYASPGMGQWVDGSVKVIYAPNADNLRTHSVVDENGEPFGLPAEALEFAACADRQDGFKLLGHPYFEEVEAQYGNCRSLLQLDCDDDRNLQFYDCGMVNLLIGTDDLAHRRFDKAFGYLHSF